MATNDASSTSTVAQTTAATSSSSIATTGLTAVSSGSAAVGSVSRQPVAINARTTNSLLSASPSSRPLPSLAGTDALPAQAEVTLISRKRLHDLVQEVNPTQSLDEDVEDILLSSVDAFVDNAIGKACEFAKHRNSTTLGARDLQLYLERAYNMYIPGFGTERVRPYKKPFTTEAHKQRLNLIRKSMKK